MLLCVKAQSVVTFVAFSSRTDIMTTVGERSRYENDWVCLFTPLVRRVCLAPMERSRTGQPFPLAMTRSAPFTLPDTALTISAFSLRGNAHSLPVILLQAWGPS